jgi:hypothetical protein
LLPFFTHDRHLVDVNIRVRTLAGGRMSRSKTIAVAIAALIVGGVFFALGLALLATLAIGGAVIGTGLAIARLVRGRGRLTADRQGLDPSMEVFPPGESEVKRLGTERKPR